MRSSRQPLRGFLRMRNSVNAIKDFPHAEECPWARLEARNDADAAIARAPPAGRGTRRGGLAEDSEDSRRHPDIVHDPCPARHWRPTPVRHPQDPFARSRPLIAVE